MIGIETANQLTDARIVGPVTHGDYMKQEVKRGDPSYVMSRSELKTFAACPSKWLAGFRSGATTETRWGSQLDCLVCSPEQFAVRYVRTPLTYPDKKSGEAKDWNWNANFCKEWRKEQGEVECLTPETLTELEAAAFALRKDPQIQELLSVSQKQVLIEANYEDKTTGVIVKLKGAVDFAPSTGHTDYGRCLADLKTCANASQRAWAGEVNSYGLDMQAGLYLDIWTAATGEDRCEFRHVLQENFPPYQIGKRILSQEFLNIGRAKYQSALRLYCQCLATDTWPNYETGNMVIDGWSITEPEAWMLQ